MKHLFIILSTLLFFSCSSKTTASKALGNEHLQLNTPKPMAMLPSFCNESSGLEYIDNNIYTMNDSGGKNVLYVLNEDGELQKEILLSDAKNIDWEDVAYDNQTFYVGDFGNNLGNRKDLLIYQLHDIDGSKTETNKIRFQYGDQEKFFIKNRNHSYDCEALLAFENELILFSKDWEKLNTRVYHLPINTEKEVTIFPSEQLPINALITGADYDEESKTLVLCGYKDHVNSIWVFRNSTPEKLLSIDYTQYQLDGLLNAQVEGVTFYNDQQVIISTEETKTFEEQLWLVDIQ